jgi:glutathione S-transferase
MEYILEEYDREHKLAPTPKEKVPRAEFLKWLIWSETSLAIPLVGWLLHSSLLPEEERDAKTADM